LVYFILLPSPFGEGLGVRLFLSPLRGAGGVQGLGVRLSPPLGEVGRGP